MGSMTLLGAGPFSNPVPPGNGWDPARLAAGATIGGGGLTVTFNSGGFTTSQAITGHATGKWYFEVLVTTAADGLLGVGTHAADLAKYLGEDSFGWGLYRTDGNVLNGAAPVGAGPGAGAGDYQYVAYDADADLIWFGASYIAEWNQDPTADPATGVGGIGMTSGSTYYPSATGKTDVYVLNVGGSAFNITSVPTGFTANG